MASAVSLSIGQRANRRGAETCTTNTRFVPITPIISSVFKRLYPRKTWAAVCDFLGLEERSAKNRLSSDRRYSDDEIGHLLRSDDGIHYLAAIMAGSNAPWWRAFIAHVKATDSRRAIAKHTRAIQEAMDAVESFDAALSRAEAALSFQDEDFMRPHVDALGAMARVPNSAMDKARR